MLTAQRSITKLAQKLQHRLHKQTRTYDTRKR